MTIHIDSPDQVSALVTDLLAMHGMRQTELAQAIGVGKGQVSQWVRNTNGMNLSSLIRVAEVFDLRLVLVPREDA